MATYQEQKEKQTNFREKRKERILRVMGGRCAICGYNKCSDALELHHIDPSQKEFGISARVDISWEKTSEELKKCILLCANCHRELHSAPELDMDLTSSFNQEICDQITQEVNHTKSGVHNFCCDCGCQIGKTSQRCNVCEKRLRRVVERPPRDELAAMIANLGFSAVGRIYGVSDNAIKKWCKSADLPTHKSEICNYVKQLKTIDE